MKLGYKYFRNNLIKLMILSVPILYVLWEHLHGKGNPNDEPGALILLAVLIVVGNVGLFFLMIRAKRKEQAASLHTRISDDTKPAA
jgi:uncharacterized membrane protein